VEASALTPPAIQPLIAPMLPRFPVSSATLLLFVLA